MKAQFLLLLSILLLSSCSSNSDELETQDLSIEKFPQKWSLYKMTGSIQYSETTGEDMEYQEFYIFNSDNSFLKTRTTEDDIITAEGSYILQTNDDGVAFLLEYSEESDLIGNCSGNKEEYLYLDAAKTTLLSSWWSCDGPGLFYKQVPVE